MDEMMVRRPERFVAMSRVYEDLAADEPALALIEAHMAGQGWVDFVHLHGGDPVGVPELSREPNPHYGWPLIDADGPVLDEDGAPILDRTKFTLVVTGKAHRLRPDEGEPKS